MTHEYRTAFDLDLGFYSRYCCVYKVLKEAN